MEATRKGNHAVSAGITPIVERVASGAHDAVDRAAEAASAAAAALDRKGGVLFAAQEKYMERARDRVRDNPLAALGVALAAGFLISRLINLR